jgi:quercetin dioxygenase-like cupin family protein
MNMLTKNITLAAIAVTLNATAFINPTHAAQGDTVKLLTASFEARKVVTIEAGDFHFVPGQVAPVHTHAAPAVGYVAKGAIVYQVEGEKPQILNKGDAFYEPVGPRILRFDNASATEEAIFVDFNLQQEGEPFIVFEKPLTENIDRRTLPTTKLGGKTVNQVDIYSSDLDGGDSKELQIDQPTLGLVAEGVVIISVKGQTKQRFVQGQSFSLPTVGSNVTIINASTEVPAKVITFRVI